LGAALWVLAEAITRSVEALRAWQRQRSQLPLFQGERWH
jgi:hypothetical protein